MLSVATDFFAAEPVFVVGAILEESLRKRPKSGPVIALVGVMMRLWWESWRPAYALWVGRHSVCRYSAPLMSK